MATGSGNKLYKPGEIVLKAGIYRVIHHGHRDPHEAGLNARDVFPACKICGVRVRFEIVRELAESD